MFFNVLPWTLFRYNPSLRDTAQVLQPFCSLVLMDLIRTPTVPFLGPKY
jgi:hypothetical protein